MIGLAIALVSCLAQDKHTLEWNPPPKRVVAVKVKATNRDHEQGIDHSLEGEAELTPTGEDTPHGPAYRMKVKRYVLRESKVGAHSEIRYVEGEKISQKGEKFTLTDDQVKELQEGLKVIIPKTGRRVYFSEGEHPAFELATGVVRMELPPTPVRLGGTWKNFEGIDMPGVIFTCDYVYTLKNIDKAKKTAGITVKAFQNQFDTTGHVHSTSGFMTYSLEDRIIKESKFKLVETEKEGKLIATFEQEYIATLKP